MKVSYKSRRCYVIHGPSSFFHSPMMNTGNQKEGTGVAFAPAEGGSRGGADPRVGANVTRPPLAWQVH